MKKPPRRNPKAAAPEVDEQAPIKASARIAERTASAAAKELAESELREQERVDSQAALAQEQAAESLRAQERELAAASARQGHIRSARSPSSEANADVAIREKLASQGIQALSGAPLIDGPDTVKIEPRRQRPRSVAIPRSGRVSAYEPIPAHSRRAMQAMESEGAIQAPEQSAAPAAFLQEGDGAANGPSKLRRISAEQAAPAPSPASTWAHRLEASRLSRLERGEEHGQQAAIEAGAAARSIASRAQASGASPRAPSSKPRSAAAGTRNAAVGIAVAYMEEFERHIAGPMLAVWRHKGEFALGIFNVAMIFALTYFFAHVSLTSRTIFLEGGWLGRLGALCWLTVLCAFLWWGLCVVGGRVAKAVFFDWLRFERIGSAYFKDDEAQ